MKAIAATIATGVVLSFATLVAQESRTRLIGHVRHDDVHFSVSVDRDDSRYLRIVAPTKDKSPQPISVKLKLRDETVVEGTATSQISIGSGGFVNWQYKFDCKRTVAIPGIFSVTVSLAGEVFELFPW